MEFPSFTSRLAYLFVHLDGQPDPLVLTVTGWSWSVVPGPYERSSSRRDPQPDRLYPPSVVKWSVSDVSAWLESVGLRDVAPALASAGVDGEVLVQLTDKDLQKEGIKVGPRRSLLARRSELMDHGKDYDIQAIVDLDSTTLRCCYQTLLSRAVVPRATLVHFASQHRGARGNRNDEPRPVIPTGTALWSLEMNDVCFSSFSNRSSAKWWYEVITISLTFPRFALHILALPDCQTPDILERVLLVGKPDAELWRRRLGDALTAVNNRAAQASSAISADAERQSDMQTDAASRSFLNAVPGFSLDSNAEFTAWGGFISWSPANHKCFPKEFRDTVRAMLLVIARMGGREWPELPVEVLYRIFRALGTRYTANPLEHWKLPESVLAFDAHYDSHHV
eukprot:m51a1_g3729 hypothetical protein (394) ;mRNA; f:24928-26161